MHLSRVFACLMLLVATPLLAQPVQISESEFTALAAGKPQVVEDFNRFAPGPVNSPVALLNGQFAGSPSMGAPWCLLSQCLTLDLVTGVFSNLPARTELWSARLLPAGAGNVYDFDVVGGGGTQRFTLTNVDFTQQGTFVGFHDPSGIQQVTVSLRTGQGVNYSLDDVTTVTSAAPVQSVPVGGYTVSVLLSVLLFVVGALLLRNR